MNFLLKVSKPDLLMSFIYHPNQLQNALQKFETGNDNLPVITVDG